MAVEIDGEHLTISDVVKVARDFEKVKLSGLQMKKFITPQTAHGYFGQTATKKKNNKERHKKGCKKKGEKR